MSIHYTSISETPDAVALSVAEPAIGKAANFRLFPQPKGLYRAGFKRRLDVILVLLAAPILVPLIATLALAIWLQDRHNPFFSQVRIGKNGNRFVIWKLRSMVPGATAHLDAHLRADPVACAEWAWNQKLRHDPRITRLGRLLRKSSLDELPQFWNVLTGDMSLVGPRPMLPDQQSLYPGTAYYALRPGITGPWQVSDRSDSAFSSRARHDATYNMRLSLWTDLDLLARTVRVVLRGTGC